MVVLLTDSSDVAILEAAHHAPSVGHSQPWDFVLVFDDGSIHALSIQTSIPGGSSASPPVSPGSGANAVGYADLVAMDGAALPSPRLVARMPAVYAPKIGRSVASSAPGIRLMPPIPKVWSVTAGLGELRSLANVLPSTRDGLGS